MKPLKMFLVACMFLVVSVVPSQAVASTRRNAHGTIQGTSTHSSTGDHLGADARSEGLVAEPAC